MQRVDDSDLSRFLYSNGGTGWRRRTDTQLVNFSGHAATKPGLSVTVQFNGTYAEVHGAAIPGSSGTNVKTRLSVNLDSNGATTFYTPTFDDTTSGPLYNQTLYKSSILKDAQHTLAITYIGADDPPVLWLDFIDYVPSPTQSPSPIQPPTSHPSSSNVGPNPLSTGAIAGISVAASSVVVVLLGLAFLLRRRRIAKDETRGYMTGTAQSDEFPSQSTRDITELGISSFIVETSQSNQLSPSSQSRKTQPQPSFPPTFDQNPPPYHA